MLSSANKINQYIITKLLNTGDYQARDQLFNQYIISPISSVQQIILKHNIDLQDQECQLLKPYETISNSDQIVNNSNNMYLCFKIPNKSIWIGQLSNFKLKSQLYCISLIYNTVNHVLRPLLSNFQNNFIRYLSTSNIWIKNHQVYLILRPRNQIDQDITNITQQNIQRKAFKYLGIIMEKLFFPNQENKSSQLLFLSLLFRSFYKQEISLSQFDTLMNDKSARIQFENKAKSSFNFHILQHKNPTQNRRYLLSKSKKPKLSIDAKKDNIFKEKKRYTLEILPPSFQRCKKKIFELPKFVNLGQNKTRNKSFTISLTQNFSSLQFQQTYKSVEKPSLFKGYTDSITRASNHDNQLKLYKGQSVRISNLIESQRDKALKKFNENPKKQQKSVNISVIKAIIYNKNRPVSIDNYTAKAFETIQENRFQKNDSLTIDQNKKNWNEKEIKITQSHQQNIVQHEKQFKENQINDFIKQLLIKKQQNTLKKDQKQTNNYQIEKQKNSYIKNIQPQKSISSIASKEQLLNKLKANQQNKKMNVQRSEFYSNNDSQFDFINIPLVNTKQIEKNKSNQNQYQIKFTSQKNVNKQHQLSETQIKTQQKIIKAQKPKKVYQNDQIQQIVLGERNKSAIMNPVKKQIIKNELQPKLTPSKIIESQIKLTKDVPKELLQKPISTQNTTQNAIKNATQFPPKSVDIYDEFYEKKQDRQISTKNKKQSKNQNESAKRLHSNHSQGASSYGPQKSVKKQIQQYIAFINKLGQAVARTSKLAKKLQQVEWYAGVYFVYKRFYYERKKIEKWIENGEPKLSRYGVLNNEEWKEWLGKNERQQLLKKVKQDNLSIEQSIQKMNKKILKKNLPGKILFHANLETFSAEQSKIAVQYVVEEFDQLSKTNKMSQEQIYSHINDMLNCVFIIAELDKKIKQKKPIAQYSIKLDIQTLNQMSDTIFELYEI